MAAVGPGQGPAGGQQEWGLRSSEESDDFLPFRVQSGVTEWVGLWSGLAEGLRFPKQLLTGPCGRPPPD